AILRRVPEKPIRIFIATLAFVQAGYFFYKAYLH
ncbi:MAG: sulfite exporter TauE/SafE family protein, partial [Lactobacillus helveticus]